MRPRHCKALCKVVLSTKGVDVKLIRPGVGLGRFILSPLAVIAMLALLATAVALAAPPDKTHPPKDQPSASVPADESEAPEVDESEAPDADGNPGACNAQNGNAPQVIADLVSNWPTKHDKGDKTKNVPPGLQKVSDRLASCPPLEGKPPKDKDASPEPDASASVAPSDEPAPSADVDATTKPGKKSGHSKKD
jgi:hypothetical protein